MAACSPAAPVLLQCINAICPLQQPEKADSTSRTKVARHVPVVTPGTCRWLRNVTQASLATPRSRSRRCTLASWRSISRRQRHARAPSDLVVETEPPLVLPLVLFLAPRAPVTTQPAAGSSSACAYADAAIALRDSWPAMNCHEADTLLLFVSTALPLFSQCLWSHLLLCGRRLLSEHEAGQAWHGGVSQLRVLGGPASIVEGRVHVCDWTVPWRRVWPCVGCLLY